MIKKRLEIVKKIIQVGIRQKPESKKCIKLSCVVLSILMVIISQNVNKNYTENDLSISTNKLLVSAIHTAYYIV